MQMPGCARNTLATQLVPQRGAPIPMKWMSSVTQEVLIISAAGEAIILT
jgi:hypothetical protein